MRRAKVIRVSDLWLMEMVKNEMGNRLPGNVNVVGAEWNHAAASIDIVFSGDRLPQVAEGGYAEVQLLRRDV